MRFLTIALLAAAWLFTAAPLSAVTDNAANSRTVLITGSNRGIGFGFVQHYAAAGWQVIATARSPERAEQLQALAAANDNVIVEQLDVTDHARIDALSQAYRDTPIDVLINNAGMKPAGRDAAIDYQRARTMFEVNVFGPVKIYEAFYSQVASSNDKKVINISSVVGSIGGGPQFPFMHNYRASKAALNAYMRGISYGTAEAGVIVTQLHPGFVDVSGQTACAKAGTRPDLLSGQRICVADSVRLMTAIIERLDAEDNGQFYNIDGATIPW